MEADVRHPFWRKADKGFRLGDMMSDPWLHGSTVNPGSVSHLLWNTCGGGGRGASLNQEALQDRVPFRPPSLLLGFPARCVSNSCATCWPRRRRHRLSVQRGPSRERRVSSAAVRFYEETVTAMNSEQERPFVCGAPGCSQRFPTEDHLMIHRHKHEMTLKFASIKSDGILLDQTPTPTRFLKNCEEVGLFSDLDCSIEHEFCKAQEEEDSKQNISLHGSTGQTQHHPRMHNHDGGGIVIQQALPSPQSSSVITQAPSTNRQIGPLPGSMSSLLQLRNRPRQPLPASMAGTLPDPTMPGSSAVLMPMETPMSMGSSLMEMQGPTHSSSCSSPHVPSMHSETKLNDQSCGADADRSTSPTPNRQVPPPPPPEHPLLILSLCVTVTVTESMVGDR
ncbi:cyclic AMP-responsive element-binding protein 5-like [Arapaima gigas]